MDTIGQQIQNGTEKLKEMQQNYRSTFSENKTFLLIAAAICVGIATRDVIADVMKDSILPLFVYIATHGLPYLVYQKMLGYSTSYPVAHLIITKLGNMVWLILVWILTLFLVYLIFTKLIKINLISNQVEIVQSATAYVTKQEANQNQYIGKNALEAPAY